MQGVVGVAVAPDPFLVGDGPGKCHARFPDREVDERRGAAVDGGPAHLTGRRAVGEAAAEARNGPVRVDVGIDAAGDDELAGGVDDAPAVARQGAGRGDG